MPKGYFPLDIIYERRFDMILFMTQDELDAKVGQHPFYMWLYYMHVTSS